jgi:LmbE family N-acetylglucosaminyl deacetylase
VNKKVLIISPHADDEILGCGGFISKYSKKNYYISVLILTNASKGAPELYTATDIIKLRNEAKNANKFVGTNKLFFENFPAIILNNYPSYKISLTINKYLLSLKPEIVLIPSANDIHDDHKVIFNAAKVSLRPNNFNNIKKILSYEVPSETEWNENGNSFNPNYFVRLTKSDIDKKVKAFLKYKSQVKKMPHPRSKEGIINLSKFRGAQSYIQYAEAYRVERMLD